MVEHLYTSYQHMVEQKAETMWYAVGMKSAGAPDFLLIPKIVHNNPRLRPTDWIVYAVIYWYEHMKDGNCFASNEAIAQVAGVGERAISGALDRMDREGYIKRIYTDEKRTTRIGIETLVYFGVHKSDTPTMTPMFSVKKEKGETPVEFNKRFFKGDMAAIEEIMLAFKNIPNPQAVGQEMRKFTLYWTETNKSGTRQKWELQQTFDIKRRFYTWLNRASSTSNSMRAGAGQTV